MVYPRKAGEAAPTCSRLAPGVLKIVTSESTDYAFVGGQAFDFNQDGLQFTGKAGTVRVFPDRVVFCMNSGAGVIGYKGTVVSGSGPFEKTIRKADLTPRNINVGGPPKTLQTIDLGSGMVLRGEAPFTASFDGKEIKIHTEGRTRGIDYRKPPKLAQKHTILPRWPGVALLLFRCGFPGLGRLCPLEWCLFLNR